MKIVTITYGDSGGAGNAIYMLHQSLKHHGFSSTLLVASKHRNDPDIVQLPVNKYKRKYHKALDVAENFLGLYKKKYGFHNRSRFFFDDYDELAKFLPPKIDILILGWISKVVDLRAISEIKIHYGCKVYWLLTDLAPLTGGCHYSYDCEGYRHGCKPCPAVKFPVNHIPHAIFKNKLDYLPLINPVFLYFGPWMSEVLEESPLSRDQRSIQVTGVGGVDNNIYKPGNKMALRAKHDLENYSKIILFAADNVLDERKGFAYFAQALAHEQIFLKDNEIAILVIGRNSEKAASLLRGCATTVIAFEYIESEALLAEYIQLSDIFVSTTLNDVGPGMLIYSLLCAVPAVSFNVGIAIDLVKHLDNGYVAKLRSAKDVCQGIIYLLSLDQDQYLTVQRKCVTEALNLFSEAPRRRFLDAIVDDFCIHSQDGQRRQESTKIAAPSV